MPNWCYNNVKISFDSDNESELRDKVSEDKELFSQFFPIPEEEKENWYDWNISNWGTKWDAKPINIEWESDCVTFNLDTAWGPPIMFYEKMEQLGYWVEAYYLEEGMAFVGQYMDGNDDCYEFGDMSADDMESELPEWVEDKFNLISQKRDNEEYEDEEENDYIPSKYSDEEKTDWYPAKTKPHYNGHYEVKTKEWPFPHLMKWNNNRWCMTYTESSTTSKITDWRGLKESEEVKEMNLQDALDDLKKEFESLMND